MQILHHVATTGLEIGEKRHPVADRLEIVDGEFHVHGPGHGQQMQDRVGGAAQGDDHNHGILERLAGHDVPGLDVAFQQVAYSGAGANTFIQLTGVHRRGRRTVGQAHTQRLDRCRHGVGRIHPSAGTRSGTGVAHDVLTLCLVDATGDQLPVALEGRDNVDRISLTSVARLDGPAVDH